jgi:hypothetical protein
MSGNAFLDPRKSLNAVSENPKKVSQIKPIKANEARRLSGMYGILLQYFGVMV